MPTTNDDNLNRFVVHSNSRMARLKSRIRVRFGVDREIETLIDSQLMLNSRVAKAMVDLEARTNDFDATMRARTNAFDATMKGRTTEFETTVKTKKVHRNRELVDESFEAMRLARLIDAENARLKRDLAELQQHVVHRDRIIDDLRGCEAKLLNDLLLMHEKYQKLKRWSMK